MSNQNSSSIFSRWLSIMLHYRKHTGSWAWILHRITGLGLTLYILIHIIALMGLLKGEKAFNEEMALLVLLYLFSLNGHWEHLLCFMR